MPKREITKEIAYIKFIRKKFVQNWKEIISLILQKKKLHNFFKINNSMFRKNNKLPN